MILVKLKRRFLSGHKFVTDDPSRRSLTYNAATVLKGGDLNLFKPNSNPETIMNETDLWVVEFGKINVGTLFLQRLPSRVQSILAAVSDLTLAKAAEISDRIFEVTPTPVETYAISGASATTTEDRLFREIEKLNKRIDSLSFSRSRSPYRCKEDKCVKPCSWQETIPAKSRGDLFFLPQESRRLFFRDRISNVSFLVDTGSDVSLLPALEYHKRHPPQLTLFAANSSTINVYGQKTLSLDLNVRREFIWTFLLASVKTPILGADFLHYFELVPDLRHKCLRVLKTKLQTTGHIKQAALHSVKTISSHETLYHDLLKSYPSITRLPDPTQPIKHNTVHFIKTNGPPVVAKPRRLTPDRLAIAKSEFQHMMQLGHLRPSSSNYASPLHMVPKKGTFDWRLVGDYRALNAQTIKDKYPIPCLADFTANLHGSKIFSQVDLVKAYHQIPMNPDDIHKTAICTPFGLFESTRMQFGLCGASATFQRFIDEVTRNLEGVYASVDNILIASRDPEEHHKYLKALFSRLHEYGLSINVSKCVFGVSKIDFLGFHLSEEGMQPLPDKVKCITEFPKPSTLTQLRRFLGLFNFYRCFIPKAAHLLAPLIQFLEGHKNKKRTRSILFPNQPNNYNLMTQPFV
ncbi:retrovirus-related Pol polyprotein from transposon opus [Trichonephila clavipes]|nr:retrovirus-related Pol polyprotein from transposon opus [Trichonephila clavipes]